MDKTYANKNNDFFPFDVELESFMDAINVCDKMNAEEDDVMKPENFRYRELVTVYSAHRKFTYAVGKPFIVEAMNYPFIRVRSLSVDESSSMHEEVFDLRKIDFIPTSPHMLTNEQKENLRKLMKNDVIQYILIGILYG